MKKILFGLAAMSTLAFSAINLTTPTNETNTWMTGELGAISVTGTVTSSVPQVQYVVYASTDGNYDANGDVLRLADFVIDANELENKFTADNPKVYVKKVNGTQDNVEELLDTDVVKFKIEADPSRTAYSKDFFTVGGGVTFEATGLLADTTLQEVVDSFNSLSSSTLLIDKASGMLFVRGDRNYYYRISKGVRFESTEQGILQVVAADAPYAAGAVLGNELPIITGLFSGGKEISNVRILVSVNL